MLTVVRQTMLDRLSDYPAVVDRYARGEASFIPAALGWLAVGEEHLLRLKAPEASTLSNLRGAILAAADGRQTEEAKGLPRRKALRVAAAAALAKAQSALVARIASIDGMLLPLREKMAQLISVLSNHTPLALPAEAPDQGWLLAFWSQAASNTPTLALYTYLSSSLHPVDRVALLQDIIGNLYTVGRIVPVATKGNEP